MNATQKSLSNEQLFNLCKKYGEQARLWRQKFAGLLPEVNRRRLYEKKGFSSIFEFAAKLAGMSQEQVRLILNLERKLEDKPVLQKMLIEGEASVSKLARITSIATTENQEFLADQVKLLSKSAVDTLVRDIRMGNKTMAESKNGNGPDQSNYGLFEGGNDQESLPGQTEKETVQLFRLNGKTSELKLSPGIFEKLLELQNKGININRMIEEFLQKREEEIATEKEELAETDAQKQQKLLSEGKSPSRYITRKTKRLLEKEHGTKCEKENCNKPSKDIHHKQRFSLSQNNDPRHLNQFCKDHHQISHSIDVKFHEIRLQKIRS